MAVRDGRGDVKQTTTGFRDPRHHICQKQIPIPPSAIIAADVFFDAGVQVMAGVVIQPGAKVGRSCIINTGVVIDHDCEINDDCHLAPGVTLSGGVVVGKRTHIGTGASVIQDIVIGEDSIVAAGSIVHENVESSTKYIQQRKKRIL
jgi:UDP-perosamine 4-acetyltransferase